MRNSLKIGILIFLILNLSGALSAEEKTRKILYYRNPMNPSITSKVPMKDSMGMDYIPVYEEEEKVSVSKEEEAMVKLSQKDIALAGVKSEPVILRHLFKEIRTVGRIAYDPELYKAEEEFIQAIKTQKELKESEISEVKDRINALVEAAKLRLQLQGLSEEQIEELSKQSQPDRSLIISDQESPYVWVYADIYEYELSWIKVEQPIKVISASFPEEKFEGKVVAIDPLLNPMTRSVRIRAKVDNPKLLLKPQMYVDVFIEAYLTDQNGEHKMLLAVPKDAVLDTGMRKIVYLDLCNGSYLGREVNIGPEAVSFVEGKKEKFYPVYGGLKEKDLVVTKGNFLLDSQSQLTGVEAGAYGGALGTKEETKPLLHQH